MNWPVQKRFPLRPGVMWEQESREMSKLGHIHSWVASCLDIPGGGGRWLGTDGDKVREGEL